MKTLTHQFTARSICAVAVSLASLAGQGAAHTNEETETQMLLASHGNSGESESIAPLQVVPPVYPWELRETGVNGRAIVRVRLDEFGKVAQSALVSASREEFGAAAMEAISQWEFRLPDPRRRQPQRHVVEIPFSFEVLAETPDSGRLLAHL